jgi:hypothetical protein
LLLLHGVEPICAEYIPSKMYEYLWMQRPILAVVYRNAQMANLLTAQGHSVQVLVNDATQIDELALMLAIKKFVDQWVNQGLRDGGLPSPYSTRVAVNRLLSWLN